MKAHYRNTLMGLSLALLVAACGSSPQQERVDAPPRGDLSGPIVEQRWNLLLGLGGPTGCTGWFFSTHSVLQVLDAVFRKHAEQIGTVNTVRRLKWTLFMFSSLNENVQ